MDGEFVKDIERIVKERMTVEVGGEEYAAFPMHRVYSDPRPQAITVRTLTGFVDYIKTAAFTYEAPFVILVENHSRVVVVTEPYGESNSRQVLVEAVLDRPVFPFGQWLGTEEFVIAASSLFAPGGDIADVLAYAGKISVNTEIGVQDDGVTQVASIKRGVSGGVTDTKKAPGQVILTPFRTFSEVDQPTSTFIFRVRSEGEGVIKLAIFEADAGSWKNRAAEIVKNYISEKITDIPIIS